MSPFFFGDSIAVGYGGNSPGLRRVGASPSTVYSFLQQQLKNNPTSFKGSTVNLSTGVSNNPSDFTSIENQLKLLADSGANVNVLGAARGRYDAQNQQLQNLSQKYGFSFLGGFDPGPDKVHPKTYASYGDAGLNLFSSATPSTVSPDTQTTQPSQEEKVQTVLAKYKGIAGELNKTTGEFTQRNWSPEESKRYDYYLNLNKQ